MMFVRRWSGLPKDQRDRFGIAAALERTLGSEHTEGFLVEMAITHGRLVEMLHENGHLTKEQVRELVGAGFEEIE